MRVQFGITMGILLTVLSPACFMGAKAIHQRQVIPERVKWSAERQGYPEAELKEVVSFCKAAAKCVSGECNATEEMRNFTGLTVQTEWGKETRREFKIKGVAGMGPSLAYLVRKLQLHTYQEDCRTVARAFR